jgi:hypothetical protein
MHFLAANLLTLGGALVALVGAVLVVRRAMARPSAASMREDLTVSRTWLLEHKSRNGSD